MLKAIYNLGKVPKENLKEYKNKIVEMEEKEIERKKGRRKSNRNRDN